MNEMNGKLRKFRLQANLSQTDVANRLGISRQAYSRYENSNTVPSVNRLFEISKIFGIDILQLFIRDTPELMEGENKI